MPSAPAATRRVPPRTSRVPALPAFVSTRVPVPALTSVAAGDRAGDGVDVGPVADHPRRADDGHRAGDVDAAVEELQPAGRGAARVQDERVGRVAQAGVGVDAEGALEEVDGAGEGVRPGQVEPAGVVGSPVNRSGVTAPGADEMTPPSVTREFWLVPVVKTFASVASGAL